MRLAAHGATLPGAGRSRVGGARPFQRMDALGRQALAAGKQPWVLYDLDDTLARTAHRSRVILREWARTPDGAPYARGIRGLHLADMRYGIGSALAKLAVPADAAEKANAFWRQRFFSSAYLKYDGPDRGAIAEVIYEHDVLHLGIAYLTGRDEPNMGAGTRDELVRLGLPSGDCTRLLLKPDPAMPDLDWKRSQAEQLVADAANPVVGSVDNAAANDNMFVQALPAGVPVVRPRTVDAPDAPALVAGVEQIARYPVRTQVTTR